MKALLGALAIVTSGAVLLAECPPINLAEEVRSTPIMVRAVVRTSSVLADLDACAQDRGPRLIGDAENPCRYSFSVEVKEVLKGTVTEKYLSFRYAYFSRSETYTFNVGDEYLFAVDRVERGGPSKLHSTACGLGGVPVTNHEAVQNLERLVRQSE
jgi:hypothetical protein